MSDATAADSAESWQDIAASAVCGALTTAIPAATSAAATIPAVLRAHRAADCPVIKRLEGIAAPAIQGLLPLAHLKASER
ncbi:hypothetical protein Cs7R123_49940 [Catellatospora sp. TT07R-123]|nr:hypothetical protein Cs7R123_49940 [Catellatospora sp. TT07R-123]